MDRVYIVWTSITLIIVATTLQELKVVCLLNSDKEGSPHGNSKLVWQIIIAIIAIIEITRDKLLALDLSTEDNLINETWF